MLAGCELPLIAAAGVAGLDLLFLKRRVCKVPVLVRHFLPRLSSFVLPRPH